MKKLTSVFFMINIITVISWSSITSVHADQGILSPNSKWLTGDWDGLRTDLYNKGYDFNLDYTSDTTANLAGGYDKDRTMRYSDQYAIGTHLDLDKIIGIPKAEIKINLTERNGRDMTLDRLQDPRSPVLGSTTQGIYGRGQTWHITQLWYRQRFLDDKLDLKLGRIPVGEDFDNTNCLFQNISLCGSLAAHGATVWYNAPISQWGGRVKYNFSPEFYGQVGVFQYNPSYLGSKGSFKLNFSGGQGKMYVTELGWLPKVGEKQLPGIYKVGAYYNSVDSSDVLTDANGNDYPVTHNQPRLHDGRSGWYVYASQQITGQEHDHHRGLTVFGHFSSNDKETATVDYQTQVGAFYVGLFDQRPKDDMGIGLSMLHVNDRLNKRNQLINQAKGITDINSAAYKPDLDAEYVAEIYYGFVLTPWLTIKPNLQLLAHPGGNKQVQDAWVAGTQILAKF